MKRIAFVMQVHPDKHQEYKRRHDEIWPELAEVLRNHGVLQYSIFLHEQTHQLFAYAEIEDLETWNAVARTDVCRKWWQYMGDIMPSNPDDSPQSTPLKEVFYLQK